MSDRSVPAFARRGNTRETVIHDLVNQTNGLDPDLWTVMDKRDNTLIEEEILHGAASSKYVYKFNIAGSGLVSGISVVGARELAAAYGGIQHTLVGSISKVGGMFLMKSFAPLDLRVQFISELANEPDFYEVLVSIKDVKTGNIIQIEKREARFEKRSADWIAKNPSADPLFERAHIQAIAAAKAFRNGVLSLIPQHVQLAWKDKMIKADTSVIITGSVIDEKRSGLLRYAARKSIPLDRYAVEALTFEQIVGLSDAARDEDQERFVRSAEALGLVTDAGQEDDEPRRVVSLPAASSAKKPPPQQETQQQQTKSKTEKSGPPPFDAYPIDEYGSPLADADGNDLRLSKPLEFAEWYAGAFTKSENKLALRENNADALDDVRASEDAKAIGILAGLDEQPAKTEKKQEKPAETQAAKAVPVALTKLQDGKLNWTKYIADCEPQIAGHKSGEEREAWITLNQPTYAGKAYAVRVEKLLATHFHFPGATVVGEAHKEPANASSKQETNLKKLDPAKHPQNETLEQANLRVSREQVQSGVAEGEEDLRHLVNAGEKPADTDPQRMKDTEEADRMVLRLKEMTSAHDYNIFVGMAAVKAWLRRIENRTDLHAKIRAADTETRIRLKIDQPQSEQEPPPPETAQ